MTFDAAERPSSGTEMPLRERLRVLLLGRVLVMTVFLVGASALVVVRPQASPLLFTELTVTILALAYAGTLSSLLIVRTMRRPIALAYLQILFDVLLATGALGVLGDVESPLALLYAFPIANAAGLLLAPGAAVAAAAGSVAYAGLLVQARPAAVAGGLLAADGILLPAGTAALGFGFLALGVGGVARRLADAERAIRGQRREMERLEELQRAVAHGVESGILVADRDGRVRSANPAAQQILSMASDSILGRDVSWLLPLLGALDGPRGARETVEYEHRTATGESRRLRIGRTALSDTYGQGIGELLVLQDVTRLEELERRLADNEGEPLVLAGEEPCTSDAGGADGLLGACAAMVRVSRLIDKVAACDATVLVTGESGTGKELVARAVHRRSARAHGPFVVVNCGAIPEALIESELFGHVRGAFTGAIENREGLFRQADGGTLFLDEIGELSPALQVRLLRVLQDRRVLPVGGNQAREVDVRVVAATHRNLEDLVEAGRYRGDLYYRLAVISVDLPPLRERGADLDLLIEHFLRCAAERHGKNVRGVSARALALLRGHPFAGNVRELENVIEHAITLCDRDTVQEGDLPESVRGIAPAPCGRSRAAEATVSALDGGLPPLERLVRAAGPERMDAEAPEGTATPAETRLPVEEGCSVDDQLAAYEKRMLLLALERADGVKKKAASLLGINYRSFRHRLQKYGLDGNTAAMPAGLSRGMFPREREG